MIGWVMYRFAASRRFIVVIANAQHSDPDSAENDIILDWIVTIVTIDE